MAQHTASACIATLAVALTTALLGAACSGADDEPAAGELSGPLAVSAAASLTDVFETIVDDFVAANPGADITVNVGSSGALSTQIREGAPADVAAFADTAPMDVLEQAGLLAGPATVFARNRLVVVTQPGNPAGIESLDELAGVGVVSLCVETAPCGSLADRLLADAGVHVPTASINRGTDARSTLRAVLEGDAVAGIVYVTDAAAAGDRVDTVLSAEGMQLPEAAAPSTDYPIAVVAGTPRRALAEAFVAYVLSEQGRAVLADAGFELP